METEIVIVVLAAFVSGGTMGAAGMLLSQWVLRKMSPPPQGRLDRVDIREIEVMKADMADIAVRLHSVDARLDFTEQLLGGALSGAQPPAPLPPPQSLPSQSLSAQPLLTQSPPTQETVGPATAAPLETEGTAPETESASPDGLRASSVGGKSPQG
jgi:hypothetical protein